MTESLASKVIGPGSEEMVTEVAAPNPGCSVRVQFGNTAIAVFNSKGRLYALEAQCGHRNGPLDLGAISDGTVACPWHGAKFDLKTGEVVGGNFFVRRMTRPVRTFQVRVIEGRIALSERFAFASSGSTPVAPPSAATSFHPA
jgi:nitrite reductase/ring-hydroxylating ferredoxin subunit